MLRPFFLSVLVFLCGASVTGQKLIHEHLTVNGVDREYLIYQPGHYDSAKRWPMVLAFHGGGGNAKNTISQYNFNPVADREGFIVVYPNGINKGWNDGRIAPRKGNTADDVKFVAALIARMVAAYAVDQDRVFSTGISNGAIFSIYLAYKMPEKILAIAPVCGSMPANLENEFRLRLPVSALFINGTKDPLVNFDGGPVLSEKAGRGEVIGTEKLLTHWLGYNQCTQDVTLKDIADRDASDHCNARSQSYKGCADSTEVVLITVVGGGHTWPGGKQYLPRFIVGEVCQDFKAEEVIWDFFKKQNRRR